MGIINAYGFISPFLFLFIIVTFFWTALTLEKIAKKKKKTRTLIPPVIFLFSTVILMMSGNLIVKYQFVKLSENLHFTVDVSPEISINQKYLYNYVLTNIYTFKRQGGSSPTSKKYILQVCEKSDNTCATIELSQDSREKNIYWVHFKPGSETYIPLGYVKFDKEISKKMQLSQYNKSFKTAGQRNRPARTPKSGAV